MARGDLPNGRVAVFDPPGCFFRTWPLLDPGAGTFGSNAGTGCAGRCACARPELGAPGGPSKPVAPEVGRVVRENGGGLGLFGSHQKGRGVGYDAENMFIYVHIVFLVTSNKCIPSSNKCITTRSTSSKWLLVASSC